VYIVLLLCVGVLLWWHADFSGAYSEGLGCYSAPPVPSLLAGDTERRELGAIDCGQPHDFEAIALLKSDGAEDRCRQDADKFLGGPRAESRVRYALLSATDRMRGGLFCALAETSDTKGTTIGSTRSMKDGMRGNRPLAITCVGGDADDSLQFSDCHDGHSGEFVGAIADGGQPEADCLDVAAAYLGLSAGEVQDRTDLEMRWLEGERTLCFVVEAGDATGRHDTLRASVKGLGKAALPR
jgi:hypothetical protein